MIQTLFKVQFRPTRITTKGRIEGIAEFPGEAVTVERREEDLTATGGAVELHRMIIKLTKEAAGEPPYGC